MMSKIVPSLVAILAGFSILSQPVLATEDKEAERKKICAKAEKRYQKLFGRPSADEDVVIVKMYKYNFCPGAVEIKRGATVRWVNVERRTSHSVWFKEQGKEESDRMFSEEKWEIKFDVEPGNYPYLCGPHWKDEGMTGGVTVVE